MGDRTLTLEDFRAALLQEQPESELNWRSPNEFILENVSAHDQETTLKRIDMKMTTLKTELTNASLALAPMSSSTDNVTFQVQPSDALDTIAQLQAELDRCNDSLTGADSLATVESEQREAKQIRAERVRNLTRLLTALEQLAEHQRLGKEFDSQLTQGSFLQACESIQSMEACTVQLSQIASSENDNNQNSVSASRVAKACRVQWKLRKTALFARLDEAFKQALVFDSARRELRIALDVITPASPTPVRLERVVEAMQSLKILTARLLDRVLPKLVDIFLTPLGDPQRYFAIEVNSTNINLPTIRLVESANTDVLGDCQQLARFLWSELFNRDTKLMTQLNLQSFLLPLLRQTLKRSIPERFEDLPEFRESMVDRVAKLDQELLRVGCLSDTDEKLAVFVSQVDVNFAKRMRERVALQAKQILAKEYTHERRVDEAVEPSFFIGLGNFSVPGDMRISRAVRELVSTANAALLDATAAKQYSSTCSEYLVRAARDCFDLARILLPFLRRQDLSNNAHVAMLHRNDLSYLAHHLVLLSHRHPNLAGELITVDLAPAFFDEADRVFTGELAMRSNDIEQLFTMANFDADSLAKISAKADAIIKSWTECGLPKQLSEQARASIADALCHGAFTACCSQAASLFAGDKEKREMLRKLTQFVESIRTRTASSSSGLRRLEQLCYVLQPHMSLPLFMDYVEAENLSQEWTAENMVNLAKHVFSKTSTDQELQEFEDKLLYY